VSAPETDCPLHHADCNPVDPRHDAEHRTERGYVKMAHYATIYGGPSRREDHTGTAGRLRLSGPHPPAPDLPAPPALLYRALARV
jgi:hypothetical protein